MRDLQIHCVPRPGKEGRERPVYETLMPLFSTHHVNAWEANSSTIVVDTLARATAHFAASDMTFFNRSEGPESETRLRRLVMRGTALECREFDTRSVAGLEGRSLNFPNLLPPQCTGHPHSAVFAVVRCCLAVRPRRALEWPQCSLSRSATCRCYLVHVCDGAKMCVQASWWMPEGNGAVGEGIVKISVPTDAGVSKPWDPCAVTVQEYCPGEWLPLVCLLLSMGCSGWAPWAAPCDIRALHQSRHPPHS